MITIPDVPFYIIENLNYTTNLTTISVDDEVLALPAKEDSTMQKRKKTHGCTLPRKDQQKDRHPAMLQVYHVQ